LKFKNLMKPTRSKALGIAAAGCALALALPHPAKAEVSDEQFNELKKLVTDQGKKIQEQDKRIDDLEKTHGQDQKVHEQDQQKIQQLQQQVNTNQNSGVTEQQKVAAAAQSQPIPRVPLDEATVNHNFSILGDAEFQFAKTDGQNGAFMLADFAPIFLYRGGDNILFEAGFDFILQNNAPGSSGATTTVNLSFAQLNYLFSDYVTLAVGNMLLPLGTYSQRSAGWLNKFPDDPLARDLLPGSGVGAQLLGAIPFGQSGQLINYSVYGVNGPSSADGTANAGALDLGGNVGLKSDNTVANLHGHPSGGGRIGYFFPYKPHFDFEIGLSGQFGEWDNTDQHLWNAGVIDASLHLGACFEAKGEFIRTSYGSADMGMVRPEGWWGQVGYKLAGLNLDLPGINNLELVGRYDRYEDGLGIKTRRYSVGYVYYLTNTLLFEGDYEFLNSNDPTVHNQLILQLSYGF
jgi:hypothetical protein